MVVCPMSAEVGSVAAVCLVLVLMAFGPRVEILLTGAAAFVRHAARHAAVTAGAAVSS